MTGSQMRTLEGCSSISDRLTGALLFYTDGGTVWNRNHQIMGNGTGLQGHNSSSHSSVVVPFPGNHRKFYIFTVPSSSTIGAKYSVVDMTLNSGLGGVVSTQKNIQLAQSSTNSTPYPVADKCAAIGHANGRDYWVVVQHNTTWSLYAYLVTSSGVSTSPVISTVTPPQMGPIPHYGCIKISPDGKKMAACYASRRTVILWDFNTSTGQCSNQITLTKSNTYLPYGVEFSPDSKLLYVNSRGVQQLDPYAGTATQILASERVIISNSSQGQLQLAPDKKIYWSRYAFGRNIVARIDSPNVRGTGCAYRDTALILPANSTLGLGLPTFIQSFFNTTTLNVVDACDSQYVKIAVQDTGAVDSVLYNYGDPSTGSRNTSWNKLDSHVFSSPGKYVVTAYPFYTDRNGKVVRDTLQDTVEVLPAPIVRLGADTTICIYDSTEARVINTNVYELYWNDSSQNHWKTIDSSGIYWVEAVNRCGSTIDSIRIDSLFTRSLNLGRDTTICRGDSIVLDISDTAAIYLWQDSTTNPIYTIKKPGVYWGKSLNVCGLKGDTIRVLDDTIPTPDLGNDTSYCTGTIFVLDATHRPGNFFTRYRWSDGTPAPRNWVRQAGDLSVEVSNKCGVGRDTINVQIDRPIQIELGMDTVICLGDTITLDPLTKGAECLWSDNSTDSVLKIYQGGTYWLRATNSCGTDSDTMRVQIETVPDVSLPQDSTLCIGAQVQLAVSYSRSTYRWQDGSTGQTFIADKSGTYRVEVTNICGRDVEQVTYTFEDPLDVELGADTILCDNRWFEKTLNLPGNPKYFWSTGSQTNVGRIAQGGRFRVSVTNVCGVFTDEIDVEQLYTPQPDLANDTVLCQGESFKLSPRLTEDERRGSVTTWQGKYQRDEYRVNQTGVYRVEVENVCGIGRDTMEIEFQKLPSLGLNRKDTNACDGKLVYDFRDKPYRLLWQDGSTKNRYVIREPGEYSVEIWDELGCYSMELFEARQCPGEFWAPSAFTPNRDGKNETWRVYKTFIYDFHIEVYNRWNEKVFESDDIEEGWNGNRMNTGAKCPVGVYTFKVSFKEEANNQFQEVLGKVSIVK